MCGDKTSFNYSWALEHVIILYKQLLCSMTCEMIVENMRYDNFDLPT